ncbi:hypothetical protein DUNSADRAFT_3955 [Dunaliella salina]|uniref:Encoded protein n=1 Tax=Dunaliella salina TaxID=3046 RepID=A0ABQ7H7Y6_DUNSA|nr:hypothetical protein DUNSADRAFT_3955 [Dunaliella salina]|eukprot:KAF5842928.1 hypothetical protein DUNSADRAFT_3955 [Dunaliella salina]
MTSMRIIGKPDGDAQVLYCKAAFNSFLCLRIGSTRVPFRRLARQGMAMSKEEGKQAMERHRTLALYWVVRMCLRDRSFPTCQLPMEQWVKTFRCGTFICQQQTCAARYEQFLVSNLFSFSNCQIELPLRWKSPACQSGRGSRAPRPPSTTCRGLMVQAIQMIVRMLLNLVDK